MDVWALQVDLTQISFTASRSGLKCLFSAQVIYKIMYEDLDSEVKSQTMLPKLGYIKKDESELWYASLWQQLTICRANVIMLLFCNVVYIFLAWNSSVLLKFGSHDAEL